MTYKHASIVPLIGGETIAQSKVFGSNPEYLLSYEAFGNNDQHCRNYFQVPYILLDQGGQHPHYVDVVNTVCPCAGLSSLSPQANSDAAANDWMTTTAEYVLGKMQPKVFWGENAPRLASKMGVPVVEKLHAIGQKYGYSLSIYKTKSLFHGLSQVRDRTFYFFWKGDRTPVLKNYVREWEKIEDAIRSVPYDVNDKMAQLTNSKKPTSDPYYRYILEVIHGGISHKEFSSMITHTAEVLTYIEEQGHDYKQVGAWMSANGYEREVEKCDRRYDKLKAGFNIMRKLTTIPKNYIGAFVGHLPMQLTHPDEDRYLTIREAMEIMKLPRDFELLGGLRNLNHICQNVPVTTAMDMATEVKAWLDGERDSIHTDNCVYVQHNGGQPNVMTKIINKEEKSSLEGFFS
jgi:site-specific DNA-cytosine methylase